MEKPVKIFTHCNLYVSKDWNEVNIPHTFVPERRPPEKIPY
jgi:hypothetical protein